VDFLKKVKTQHSKLQYVKNIETSLNGITENRFFGKRLFDIVVSVVALVLLSPLFLLIAIVIKLESRGPVFYIAQRAGRGYRIFNFFKFRTMVAGADKKVDQLAHLNQYNASKDSGPVFFKVSNDPRITKVGAFLRNTSLDELPQLINVLLGDMSLVGNRPLPLYEAATLTTDEWAARFLAPAGITGLWQIKKRGHKEMSVEERIQLDIDYSTKCSFLYDLWIMANTPFVLVQKSNV
jgi:lipopolysaccharide/colanic/teichoic acid biosynthesis glycosyltransferase